MNAAPRTERKPLGVLLIAGFYAFGAIVLLFSLFVNPAEVSRVIAERHGLLSGAGIAFTLIVAALGLVISYGLYSLSRWGFFVTIAYLLYFGVVSIALGGLNFVLSGQGHCKPTSGTCSGLC